jgi:GNAT superfamily N-acetyltransferase
VTLRVETTDAPGDADRAAVLEGLQAFNAAATPGIAWDYRPLAVLLRDGGSGAVVGGLVGRTAARWLYVELLHVPEPARGAGHGARLLAGAEDEARARGCIGARLDTYSFQARGFYERLGYTVTGAIEDCPPGHTRWSMAKRLDRG